MVDTCPHCGKPYRETQVAIDTEAGTVATKDREVRLTPHEMVVFSRLFDAKGRMVTKGMLLDDIYGLEGDEPAWAADSIRVRVHALRKKLSTLGFVINCNWGRGYSMEMKR